MDSPLHICASNSDKWFCNNTHSHLLIAHEGTRIGLYLYIQGEESRIVIWNDASPHSFSSPLRVESRPAGSIVVASSSHGATLPADIPAITVSTSSAALCLNECTHKLRDMMAIDEELNRRETAGFRYVDNLQSFSIYRT